MEHPRLWREYWRCRSDAARNALLTALLDQAVGVACKVINHARRGHVITTDERAEVSAALARVIERYDPSRAALSTYMWCVVRGAVLDLWRRQGWFPRRFFKARSEAGRSVTMMSLDKMREDAREESDHDHVCERVPAALVDERGTREIEEAVEARDQCERWVGLLRGQDELVMRRRYLDGAQFAAIAREMRVTPQRVCYIHRRALGRIREHEEGRTR